MRNTLRLGTIIGAGFKLDVSWFIVFALGTWSLARYYLPDVHPGWSPSAYWVFGAITSALFFASVLAHELAHLLVARVYGSAKNDSTLFIFGGMARIGQEPRLPHEEVLIALAGPGVSLVLATLFYEVWRLGLGIGGPIHALAGWLGWLNLMLALLNLIPAFPLDGGRIFRAVLWDGTGDMRRATTIALGIGRLVALSLIFYGSWLGLSQLRVGLWGEGLWIAIFGWLLHRAITRREQQSTLHDRELLSGHTVREAMLADCPRVLGRLTLDIVVAQVVQPSEQRYFLVGTSGQFDGLLVRDRIAAVPRKRWPNTRVEDIMLPSSRLKSVGPDAALTTVLEQMTPAGEREFIVVHGERPIGLITRDTLARFIRERSSVTFKLIHASTT